MFKGEKKTRTTKEVPSSQKKETELETRLSEKQGPNDHRKSHRNRWEKKVVKREKIDAVRRKRKKRGGQIAPHREGSISTQPENTHQSLQDRGGGERNRILCRVCPNKKGFGRGLRQRGGNIPIKEEVEKKKRQFKENGEREKLQKEENTDSGDLCGKEREQREKANAPGLA